MLSTPAKLKTALAVLNVSFDCCVIVTARLTHDCPETQELSPRASGNVLNERSRVLPVPEADAWSARDASKVDYQSQNDQENDK